MMPSRVLISALVVPMLFGCAGQSASHDAGGTKAHDTFFTPGECSWMSKDYFLRVFGSQVPKVIPKKNPIGTPPQVPPTYGCEARLPLPEGDDTTVLSGLICPGDCTLMYQAVVASEHERHEIPGLGTHAFWYPFGADTIALEMLTSQGANVSLVLKPVPGVPLLVDQVTALKTFAAKAEETLKPKG